ncbi:hypothetical protein K1T35_48145 (plasmid) [Pseudonocardia sp. DSM 110487]|uniref:hypothetical protein n=1 Tax=Pseudonocardia sp. DSM 110487 TaxID=2865833 RepID=UPI001C69F7F4|nr:hypothetical protein [Pseudonocardia sp. DSM 110487]QYN41121.1 hypothetical protein K1T35_48145 [Pseudonocardia sp. DSM 110487]
MSSRASTAAAALDEPDKWAVALLYDGEMLGAPTRELFTSPRDVQKRKAELRRLFPSHQVIVLRRTVEWIEDR